MDKIHILDTNLKYNGTGDSNITYTVTPTSNINVDILVVGGGGGGGLAGAGGADVEYIQNYELTAGTEYTFKVGKGGDIGNIGGPSEMSNIGGSIYKVLGGGNGGSLTENYPEVKISDNSVFTAPPDTILSSKALTDMSGETMVGPFDINVDNKDYVIYTFKYNSAYDNTSGQTEYSLTFDQDTECDIVVVGGGGGGGVRGGGGGAGGVISGKINDLINIQIKIGKGGIGAPHFYNGGRNVKGTNGQYSSITFNNNTYIASGGGGGASIDGWYTGKSGSSGGSGGGAAQAEGGAANSGDGGTSTQAQYSDFTTYGTRGGNNRTGGRIAAGGGGAIQEGGDSDGVDNGFGGNGLYIGDIYSDNIGENGYIAGGGSGFAQSDSATHKNRKGLGGGGEGLNYINISITPATFIAAEDGLSHTGGGEVGDIYFKI